MKDLLDMDYWMSDMVENQKLEFDNLVVIILMSYPLLILFESL